MVRCMTDWTAGKVLSWAVEDFKARGFESARLEAELLLAHVLGVSRLSLYTGYDRPLEGTELSAYKQAIVRRRGGEPLAYITGVKEFWSLSFEVTKDVLIPRPDTETLVEAALSRLGAEGRVLDLCTGTGCVAAALASERPGLSIDAVDISQSALAVAARNIERLGLMERVRLFAGDLFEPVLGQTYDLITANPPYVIDGEIAALQPEVRREPKLALEGGSDGLDVVRRILTDAPRFLKVDASILIEIDPRQVKTLVDEVGPRFFNAIGEVISDLSHTPRVVVFKKTSQDDE